MQSRRGSCSGSGVATLAAVCVLLVCIACSQAGPGGPGPGPARVCEHKGQRFLAGAKWTTPGGRVCAEHECGDDGAVTTTWCSHVYAGRTCRLVRGDASAPYPRCCPHIRCGA